MNECLKTQFKKLCEKFRNKFVSENAVNSGYKYAKKSLKKYFKQILDTENVFMKQMSGSC